MSRLVLGVHIGHDRGAALVRDGELVAQIAEERLDRQKHSNSPALPMRAIRSVLESSGVTGSQLSAVGVSYTNVTIENIVEQLRDELQDVLSAPACPVAGVSHHLAHAYSALFTSQTRDAVILVADGAGDLVGSRLEAESLYLAEKGKIRLLERRLQDISLLRTDRRNSFVPAYMHSIDKKKQISLGRKYEQFTYLCGFLHGEAGKTMGLASYAEPLFEPFVPKIDSIDFSLSYEEYVKGVEEVYLQQALSWHRFVAEKRAAIAALGQKIIERFVLGLLEAIHHQVPHSSLCAAGGLFLNCVLNGQILEKRQYEYVHVVPAAGDDGQAVGAAFAEYERRFGPPAPRPFTPYLGPAYDPNRIESALDHFRLGANYLDDELLPERLAWDLEQGRIVALFRGRSEFGPRALGHRSILADPRPPGMRNCLNRIKGREWFRPVAPLVAFEDAHRFFLLNQESPYMLLTSLVAEDQRATLAAATHEDGSARIQTVTVDEEPFLCNLLRAFERRTGIPVLLNTSFNTAGEPIVESPHDAIRTFLACPLDILVLDNFYVDRSYTLVNRREIAIPRRIPE